MAFEPTVAPFTFRSEQEHYAERANRIAIKHRSGKTLDIMPDYPLFLWEGMHVKVPLEKAYELAWLDTPEFVRLEVAGVESSQSAP